MSPGDDRDPVAVMVHELRQPLTTISGRVHLAKRYLASDAVLADRALDEVANQVRRMDRLLREMNELLRKPG